MEWRCVTYYVASSWLISRLDIIKDRLYTIENVWQHLIWICWYILYLYVCFHFSIELLYLINWMPDPMTSTKFLLVTLSKRNLNEITKFGRETSKYDSIGLHTIFWPSINSLLTFIRYRQSDTWPNEVSRILANRFNNLMRTK